MSIKDEQIKYLQYRVEALRKELQLKEERNFLQVKEDLENYYEIDLDNCLMNNIDWIEQIALLMTNKDYDKEILSEINLYKKTREQL
tara:strand:- start:1655 stop:1915 length:261 start_codon:yes stop_codon:yes gene_type:complete